MKTLFSLPLPCSKGEALRITRDDEIVYLERWRYGVLSDRDPIKRTDQIDLASALLKASEGGG